MAEQIPPRGPARPLPPLKFSAPGGDDAVNCGRCGGDMRRLHAAWHCPGCGVTTDSYGW